MGTMKSYYYLSDQEYNEINTANSDKNLRLIVDLSLDRAMSVLEPLGLNAYTDYSKNRLLTLSATDQKASLVKLMDYTSYVEAMINRGLNLKDDKSCLKAIQKMYGLRISKEFMASIKGGDAVEILDKNGVQVYRNLSLLQLTDYDVLFLSSCEWPDLYKRDVQITNEVIRQLSLLLDDKIPLFEFKVKDHLMVEKESSRRLKFWQRFKFGCSVLNDKEEIVGLALSISASVVGDKTNDSIGFLHPN